MSIFDDIEHKRTEIGRYCQQADLNAAMQATAELRDLAAQANLQNVMFTGVPGTFPTVQPGTIWEEIILNTRSVLLVNGRLYTFVTVAPDAPCARIHIQGSTYALRELCPLRPATFHRNPVKYTTNLILKEHFVSKYGDLAYLMWHAEHALPSRP